MEDEGETMEEWRARMRRGVAGLKALERDISEKRAEVAAMSQKRKRGPRTRLPRCPRCAGVPVRYQELWRDHTMDFEADEHGMPEEEGYMEAGHAYRVDATCGECGHTWTLRGVGQITALHELT